MRERHEPWIAGPAPPRRAPAPTGTHPADQAGRCGPHRPTPTGSGGATSGSGRGSDRLR
ncbi:hypothetical protein KPATCC21470_7401 [Kitasatospora purpeofusca]